MNGMPMGWPERILFGLLTLFGIVLALVFGTLVMGLGAIAVLGLTARMWWLQRRLRRDNANSHVTIIEGEYQVLEG